MIRSEVYAAIDRERQHQIDKFGAGKQQSVAGFLLILESELNEAKVGWIKSHTDRHSPLNEIVQIAATAVACLERYGITGVPITTDDAGVEVSHDYCKMYGHRHASVGTQSPYCEVCNENL